MIKVYSTSNCVFCPMVKKFLKHMGKKFEEIDVTNDLIRLQEETGFTSVPITLKEGSLPIVGYNASELAKL